MKIRNFINKVMYGDGSKPDDVSKSRWVAQCEWYFKRKKEYNEYRYGVDDELWMMTFECWLIEQCVGD